MKILTSIVTAAVLGVAAMSSASAADVYFKNPIQFKGTGCPGDNSVEVIGANTASLTVLFGQYDAGKNSMSGLDRAGCGFAIPIKVPRGFQFSEITADWEGYVKGKGELKRKYFLTGQPTSQWQTNAYNKPSGGNYSKRDSIYHASLATGCNGGQYNLRISSQVRTLVNGSYIAVDSADLNNRLIFKLKFKKC